MSTMKIDIDAIRRRREIIAGAIVDIDKSMIRFTDIERWLRDRDILLSGNEIAAVLDHFQRKELLSRKRIERPSGFTFKSKLIFITDKFSANWQEALA
jgi:hypothetical protein